MGMEGDRMGPKGGGQAVCAKPSFSTSTLDMTIPSSQEQKQRVGLTLLFHLFVCKVLFLMHHLTQH